MGGGLLRLYGNDLVRLERVLDPLIAAALFWWIPSLRGSHLPPEILWPGGLIVLLFTVVFFSLGNIYQTYRQISLLTLLRRITFSWSQVLTALLLLGFATKLTARFSRLEYGVWALFVWLVLISVHVGGRLLLRWYRIKGGNTRTLVFWGSPVSAVDFYQQLTDLPHLGLRLVAWFQPPNTTQNLLPPGMPSSDGGLLELRRWLDTNDVDLIFFSYVSNQDLSMQQLIQFFGDTCKPVFYVPPWSQPSMRFQVDQIGRLFCLGLWGSQESMLDRRLKLFVDLLLAGIAVIVLAPVLVLVAALVALTSPGPVLFCQDRYGLDGRRFRIYKFRTMTETESGNQHALRQAQRGDPRITSIGRILRSWSLDELPQLFNVLNGSMSLVGPRPHAVEHNEIYRKLISGYMQRHQFKPGITGLAQVEGWRGETSDLQAMASRIEADLRYQREWSLSLDIKILIKTILKIHSSKAY